MPLLATYRCCISEQWPLPRPHITYTCPRPASHSGPICIPDQTSRLKIHGPCVFAQRKAHVAGSPKVSSYRDQLWFQLCPVSDPLASEATEAQEDILQSILRGRAYRSSDTYAILSLRHHTTAAYVSIPYYTCVKSLQNFRFKAAGLTRSPTTQRKVEGTASMILCSTCSLQVRLASRMIARYFSNPVVGETFMCIY